MTRRAVLLLLLWLLFGGGQSHVLRGDESKPTVVLVSFDGWRWDYESLYSAPNLHRLIARGVGAELIPSYPSKTFPNHYTIVTGLYPGHHGIVANSVKDPPTGRRMTMSNSREVQDPMWWGGEPIWVTLQHADQRTASMFWPGTEAPIEGVRPNFWAPFDDRLPVNIRVDRVLSWLDLPPERRPTLITLYIGDVDGAGHENGPNSMEVRNAVRRADGYLGRLVKGLERRRLSDRVNIVAVSDHGMAETSLDRVVILDDYISLSDVEVIDINPTLGLFPRPGREDAVYAALVKAHPRLKVYRRAETPEHWHYRDHPRIPPIVGVVDEGWQIMVRDTFNQRRSRGNTGPRGEHGYDPIVARSMHGIFVAAGPAFKTEVTVPAFENVNIYDVLCDVLGVMPARNDGDPAFAKSVLR
ncbi:MAG TPA: ectonucleotide pyrophosphatase/phosphodiesterase [Vicinamibacterales bacterium]